MDEPRDVVPRYVWLRKSETNNGVGCIFVWSCYLRGMHNFRCLVAASKPRDEQLICGHGPFPDMAPWTAVDLVLKGVRPTQPTVGFADSLWMITESCWQHERKDRPSASTVAEWLDEVSRA